MVPHPSTKRAHWGLAAGADHTRTNSTIGVLHTIYGPATELSSDGDQNWRATPPGCHTCLASGHAQQLDRDDVWFVKSSGRPGPTRKSPRNSPAPLAGSIDSNPASRTLFFASCHFCYSSELSRINATYCILINVSRAGRVTVYFKCLSILCAFCVYYVVLCQIHKLFARVDFNFRLSQYILPKQTYCRKIYICFSNALEYLHGVFRIFLGQYPHQISIYFLRIHPYISFNFHLWDIRLDIIQCSAATCKQITAWKSNKNTDWTWKAQVYQENQRKKESTRYFCPKSYLKKK